MDGLFGRIFDDTMATRMAIRGELRLPFRELFKRLMRGSGRAARGASWP